MWRSTEPNNPYPLRALNYLFHPSALEGVQLSTLFSRVSFRLPRDFSIALECVEEWERLACVQQARALLSNVLQDLTRAENAPRQHGVTKSIDCALRLKPYAEHVAHGYQLAREAIAIESSEALALSRSQWLRVDQMIEREIHETLTQVVAEQMERWARHYATLARDASALLEAISTGAELALISRDLESAKILGARLASNARRLEKLLFEATRDIGCI